MHAAAEHHCEHPGDDAFRVRDHLLAGRAVGHHEPIGLGFGRDRVDVDADDLAGQVESVEVRRQRLRHVGDQRGLREPHHHRGGEVVLVDEVAVQHRLRNADVRGDLVHADVAAPAADSLQRPVHQLVATVHLVLVPSPLATVNLRGRHRDSLYHCRGCPFISPGRYYGPTQAEAAFGRASEFAWMMVGWHIACRVMNDPAPTSRACSRSTRTRTHSAARNCVG